MDNKQHHYCGKQDLSTTAKKCSEQCKECKSVELRLNRPTHAEIAQVQVEPSTESESVPSAEKYLETCEIEDIYIWDNNENRYDLSYVLEQFANLCVEQKTKEWEKEELELNKKLTQEAFLNLRYVQAITFSNSLEEIREKVNKLNHG